MRTNTLKQKLLAGQPVSVVAPFASSAGLAAAFAAGLAATVAAAFFLSSGSALPPLATAAVVFGAAALAAAFGAGAGAGALFFAVMQFLG